MVRVGGKGGTLIKAAGVGGIEELKLLELMVIGQSAGNLNLSNASTWNESKVLMKHVKIEVTSGLVTNFDIAVYTKDTFLDKDIVYKAKNLSSSYLEVWSDFVDWIYVDEDSTKEIHLKITENIGGPGIYAIEFHGIKLV